MKPNRIIKPNAEGTQPVDDPMPSWGPETGGTIEPSVEWSKVITPPASMSGAVLDIGQAGLGEELDKVDPLTAWLPSRQSVATQGPRNDLGYIRSLFPFLPIMPFPNDVVSVVLTTASLAVDLNLPDGTIIVNFDADGTDWYISNFGRAVIPNVGAGDSNNQGATAMVHPPNNVFFYTGSLRQISCFSPTAGRIVQARCWITPVRMRQNVPLS